jgi:hypothetical protein
MVVGLPYSLRTRRLVRAWPAVMFVMQRLHVNAMSTVGYPQGDQHREVIHILGLGGVGAPVPLLA